MIQNHLTYTGKAESTDLLELVLLGDEMIEKGMTFEDICDDGARLEVVSNLLSEMPDDEAELWQRLPESDAVVQNNGRLDTRAVYNRVTCKNMELLEKKTGLYHTLYEARFPIGSKVKVRDLPEIQEKFNNMIGIVKVVDAESQRLTVMLEDPKDEYDGLKIRVRHDNVVGFEARLGLKRGNSSLADVLQSDLGRLESDKVVA